MSELQLGEAGGRVDGEPAGAVTRLLWYAVEELPGPALRVRRVAAPADAPFLRVCLALWFGFALCLAPGFMPWPMVLLVLALGVFVFCGSFYTLGLGAEEWWGERDGLVVRRRLLGRKWERRYAGVSLQITENRGTRTHTLSLSVHRSRAVAYLLNLNRPTAEQTEQVHALGKRLAQVTGWRLETVP